jgi:hypothetical protein
VQATTRIFPEAAKNHIFVGKLSNTSLGIGSDWPMIFWSGLTVCDAHEMDEIEMGQRSSENSPRKMFGGKQFYQHVSTCINIIQNVSTCTVSTSIQHPLPRYFDLHRGATVGF